MKKLRIFKSIFYMTFFNIITTFSMEVPIEHTIFLKKPIYEIQDFAETLSKETGYAYQILEKSFIVNRSLETLGLTRYNTPLDIRYHYDLLMQKLSIDEPVYDIVKLSYENLMNMLSAINGYRTDIEELMHMKAKNVDAMELQEIADKYNFVKNKGQSIKNTVKRLRKQFNFKKQQLKASHRIKDLFDLPDNASFEVIKATYNDYINNNSLDTLIALKNMRRISSQAFKNKRDEIEKVKKTYANYLKEIEQFK